MEIKYNKSTLKILEQIFEESDYKVRYERGQFKSGYCLIHQKKIVVINKFFDEKGRIDSFLDILSQISLKEQVLSDRSKAFLKIVEKSLTSDLKVA